MDTVEKSMVEADDAPKLQEAEGFYKSQEEVDKAFAFRMAAEREKWEKENMQQIEKSTGEEEVHDADAQPQEMDFEQERAFIRAVEKGKDAIMQMDPHFELQKELEENPMFALMIAQGIDAKRAYDFFYPKQSEGQLRKSVEDEVLARIRMRNNRPRALDFSNTATTVRDISRMSDEEILDIDERIKKGERITL